MPLISTKGAYGLVAMYELSKNDKDTPMQIRQISVNTDIPQNYLEQLLSKLRKAKLVESTRGAKGGYKLAQNPKNIKIIDILVSLEGDLRLIDIKSKNPLFNIFFDEKQEKIKELFNINLASLDKYQEKYNELLHYTI